MIHLQDISLRRRDREILAVDNLELALDQVTVILGHNGSGKSTLMSLLARQIAPDRGSVTLNGEPLARLSQRDLARRIAFLPQRLPEVAGLSVRELVRLGRFPWRGTFGRWRVEDHAIVERALAETDVAEHAEAMADQLSGGERQRAWVAMLLAQEAPLLLLDEPTSALDLAHQYDLMSRLRDLNRKHGRGIVAILHDVNLAARFADRVIGLKGGRLAFDGPPAALLSPEVLSRLYGIEIALVAHPRQDRDIAVVA